MKISNKILLSLSFTFLLVLTGCGLFGSNPAAPTKFESTLYDIQTNFVQQVVNVTNVIQQINTVVQYATNQVGQIVTVTNTVVVPQYNLVTVTNIVPAYTLVPKAETTAGIGVVGTLSNMAAPGIGGLVTGGLIALAGLWGKLRSYKATGGVLAQNVEQILEWVKTLPNGEKYNQVIQNFMQTHQIEAGVLTQVLDLIKTKVSNPNARVTAEEIQAMLSALGTPSPTPPAGTPGTVTITSPSPAAGPSPASPAE